MVSHNVLLKSVKPVFCLIILQELRLVSVLHGFTPEAQWDWRGF